MTPTPQVLIFDFDGTIADTQDTFIAIANRLAPDFGHQPLTPQRIAELRDLHSRAVIKASGLPFYKLPFFLRRVKQELQRDIHSVRPIAGIPETLIELQEQGYRLGIITSNLPENVNAFLTRTHLRDRFEFVQAGIAIFGKCRSLRRVLRQLQLPPTAAAYCGDETRDIEAARRCGVAAIAVGWGFNSQTALQRLHPDAFVNAPQELAAAIGQLQPGAPSPLPTHQQP